MLWLIQSSYFGYGTVNQNFNERHASNQNFCFNPGPSSNLYYHENHENRKFPQYFKNFSTESLHLANWDIQKPLEPSLGHLNSDDETEGELQSKCEFSGRKFPITFLLSVNSEPLFYINNFSRIYTFLTDTGAGISILRTLICEQ